ncbi:hypothetical protein K503DRAFT_289140 [Rhizopogon vinicolor AM-OR11-026]|uniref:NADP-dependent oxidoreductase domain-containing protein n=1 Tax=Rhizopogon vinicolor AM-OR11-026 TaxID=1314800 RepID=A0A1B7MVD4_9AGAM|nr:hypothetical protein K503DRAFT_289140 [Rhizopogon vinicolor AM-OR11-026]
MILGPDWERTKVEKAMSAALEKVAKGVGAKHITAVAIAYLMQKVPYVFPLIGGRKVEHLEANLESLAISLTAEQLRYLESVVPFNPGFPHHDRNGTVYNFLLYMEKQPTAQPIIRDAE